jgi:hypothetical protein
VLPSLDLALFSALVVSIAGEIYPRFFPQTINLVSLSGGSLNLLSALLLFMKNPVQIVMKH